MIALKPASAKACSGRVAEAECGPAARLHIEMRRILVLTLPIAAVLGVLAALVLIPDWEGRAALEAIRSTDVEVRAAGWAWLTEPDDSGEPRATGRLDQVNQQLRRSPDDALLHGATMLRRLGLWGWDNQKFSLILRELSCRLDLPVEAERLTVIGTLQSAPRDLDPNDRREITAVLNEILANESATIRRAVFEAACAWCGRAHAERLDELEIPESDVELRRLRRLALTWAQTDTDTARLVRREAPDPLAMQDGAWRILADPDESLLRKRIAAWRCEDVDPDTVSSLLATSVADRDESVYAAALLTERRLPHGRAVALAERWIRSFDDDEKRAGALLAALLGEHADLLAEAYVAEDVSRVRTTQRLALWALGRSIDDVEPIELAHRSLHRTDGDFDSDVALCMLIAGRRLAIAELTAIPAAPDRAAIQRRAWLIERFLPGWRDAAGPPPVGDDRAIRLHFDRLEALRLLTLRDVRFDSERRIFVEEPASTQPLASN
jgi:hypothetical protein